MIEVENLTKFYGPRPAIQNFSFNVNRGEVVGFLGPNGAGKSTTMNILTCILPATRGTARICGHDIFEESLEVKKIIGYLPEVPPLYQDMVVNDFLYFSARIRHVPRTNIAAAVGRVLEKCGLGGVRHRIVGRLSKGFQQRVGLAQALIHNPDILILDEPTIGLDPLQIIEIRKLIQELSSSHTIILSSHILPEVTQICQRVIIINEGEIAAMDTLEGLTSSMRHTERIRLRVRQNGPDVREKLLGLDAVEHVHAEENGLHIIETKLGSNLQDSIARLALDNDWGIVELNPVAMTLEDIFLKLTTEEKGVTV